MKRILAILLAAAAMAGCNQDEEDTTLDQMKRIVSYLTTSHSPRLITEAEIPDYMDDANPPQFYSVFGRAAYRYIVNYYDEGRDSRREVVRGSRVGITYAAYDFTGFRNVTIAQLYATNDSSLRPQMEDEGWTLDDNPFVVFEPRTVTAGGSDVIGGVSMALVGCREGDEVEIYCTSSLAYRDSLVGIVEKNSPVYWHVVIESVE